MIGHSIRDAIRSITTSYTVFINAALPSSKISAGSSRSPRRRLPLAATVPAAVVWREKAAASGAAEEPAASAEAAAAGAGPKTSSCTLFTRAAMSTWSPGHRCTSSADARVDCAVVTARDSACGESRSASGLNSTLRIDPPCPATTVTVRSGDVAAARSVDILFHVLVVHCMSGRGTPVSAAPSTSNTGRERRRWIGCVLRHAGSVDREARVPLNALVRYPRFDPGRRGRVSLLLVPDPCRAAPRAREAVVSSTRRDS
ncbi:hypothetical protein C8D87_102781 [Lentzea atacamensis]|uniref:Uncharacterized protein n=1 Tax=Lentzea atacamensis TaxID=531938 RepID=A0ABX9EH06_9PSEU|nr:hypothetical protein C8D87_102781 [Lentzea atacamensis]